MRSGCCSEGLPLWAAYPDAARSRATVSDGKRLWRARVDCLEQSFFSGYSGRWSGSQSQDSRRARLGSDTPLFPPCLYFLFSLLVLHFSFPRQTDTPTHSPPPHSHTHTHTHTHALHFVAPGFACGEVQGTKRFWGWDAVRRRAVLASGMTARLMDGSRPLHPRVMGVEVHVEGREELGRHLWNVGWWLWRSVRWGSMVVGLLGRGHAPGDPGVAMAVRPMVPVPQQQTCKWWWKSAIPARTLPPRLGTTSAGAERLAGREGRGFGWAWRLCLDLDVGSRRRLASLTGPRCYQHCIPNSLIIQSRFALYGCVRVHV